MEPGHDARARKLMCSLSTYIQRNLISPFSARSEQIENRRFWLHWVLDRPNIYSIKIHIYIAYIIAYLLFFFICFFYYYYTNINMSVLLLYALVEGVLGICIL